MALKHTTRCVFSYLALSPELRKEYFFNPEFHTEVFAAALVVGALLYLGGF